jgi:diguanylate cyclase (GGDEF)-like protein
MGATLLSGRVALGLSRPVEELTAAANQGRYADTIFGQLTQANGLPSPAVATFTQDADGFIWVGTQSGLARWDGYHCRVYQAQLGVAGTIPDNLVQALYTDSRGNLWVGTNAGGLARYDRDRDNFVVYTAGFSERGHGSISKLAGDGAHGLWVGTEGGLEHFDIDTGRVTDVTVVGDAAKGARRVGTSDRILSLLNEKDGRLWVGTEYGLFESDSRGAHFTEWEFPGMKDRSAGVMSLMRDSGGRLWVGTRRGAYFFERGQKSAQRVEDRSPEKMAMGDETVTAILEPRPGVVWLGTYGQGIVSVHTCNFELHRINHNVALPTSLADDWVQSMFLDRSGIVWAATQRGVSHADRTRLGVWTYFGAYELVKGISDLDVFSVLARPDGAIWLGLGRNGVEMFDRSGRRMGALPVDPVHPQTALPKGIVQGLVETPGETIYVASSAGVYRVGTNGKALTRVEVAGGVYPSVNELIYDRQYGPEGTLWVGCGNGLWRLDLRAGETHLLERVSLHGELTDGRVMSLLRGKNNDLWVGTQNGLNRVDLATMQVERIEPDRKSPAGLGGGLISSMLFDRRGRMWVGTFGGGIDVLEGRDASGRMRFRRLLKGLPNTNVNMLLEAADGHIWASTDDGLAVVDPESFAIQAMRAPDGVAIQEYWTTAGAATPDGRLIFGGLGGMTVIQPEQVRPWTYAAPIVVTDARIGSKQIPAGELNGAGHSQALRIEPGDGSLTVEFAALDYTAPELNQYAYRLVGFDRAWIVTDPTRRLASYTNLPPGDYRLELRGSNRAGAWSETRVVSIQVLPTWYQTIWFRLLMVLLGALVLGGVFLAATAYLRARQRELERQVALRTAELEKMTTELQQSQQQLEQMAYSDSLTGLPNRRMFNEYFRRLLALKRRQRGTFVLMVIDMDDFKDVNDTHGHDAGDALLQAVGTRLGRIVRESDCFARLGGDEFAMLLAESSDLAGIAHVCGLIEESFREPVRFRDVEMRPTLSIGVAFYPDGGETQDSLFKTADLALYEVKRGGGNGWRIHGGVPDGSGREVEFPLTSGD